MLKVPFDLPELCEPISIYLLPADLVSCVRVCRIWKDNLDVGQRPDPNLEAMTRHRHFIKDLSFHGVTENERASLQYPNLTTLFFGRSWSISAASLNVAPILDTLKLSYVRFLDSSSFWVAVSKLPNLRRLETKSLQLDRDSTHVFWMICSRLESLQTWHDELDVRPAKTMVFPLMKSLSVLDVQGANPRDLAEWFMKCPNLVNLNWKHSMFFGDDSLSVLPIGGAWPHLETLRLDGSKIDLAKFLCNMSKPRELHVAQTGFSNMSFEVLQPRLGALRKIDFPNATQRLNPNVTGRMIHEILCSNPQLQALSGCRVKATDFLDDRRPWVCGSSLRFFKIYFVFPQDGDDTTDLQRTIFRRLSTLTSLEVLDVSGALRLEDEGDKDGLDLRLKSGLGELSTLRLLKQLCFERTKQLMGEEDVIWISKHWERLQLFQGIMNEDPYTQRQFCRILWP
ncbi:hypothetical protein BGZ65_005288 [Modicella reniformis]|uniref:F-box domain-containing protein n=1 Tax=Modicella reniformis TaxID=1440133 RepID=A0A9P6M2Q9_9FUNG|nr:hypothetical protein BGZ65_005288 [Modicella reniformis]